MAAGLTFERFGLELGVIGGAMELPFSLVGGGGLPGLERAFPREPSPFLIGFLSGFVACISSGGGARDVQPHVLIIAADLAGRGTVVGLASSRITRKTGKCEANTAATQSDQQHKLQEHPRWGGFRKVSAGGRVCGSTRLD